LTLKDAAIRSTHITIIVCLFVCLFLARQPPVGEGLLINEVSRSHDHTQRRTTVGRTPLDEWPARRRDLCLTTHSTHDRLPCPRWKSNPQFQQVSGRRPTP